MTQVEELVVKKSFVENELADLLKAATHGYVTSCEYYGGVLVEVLAIFSEGHKGAWSARSIEVTGKSCLAITETALEEIKRPYAFYSSRR